MFERNYAIDVTVMEWRVGIEEGVNSICVVGCRGIDGRPVAGSSSWQILCWMVQLVKHNSHFLVGHFSCVLSKA